MASSAQRSCPKCDTPLEANQQYCSNCGAPVSNNAAGSNYTTQAPYSGAWTPPPPPPPPYTEQPVEQQQMYAPVPEYARVPKPKRSSWRKGCIITLATLLVLLLLCGGSAYYGYQHLFRAQIDNIVSSAQPNTTGSTSNGNNNSSSNGGQSIATSTTQLGLNPVTYASVNITLQDVQQADSFVDDSPYNQHGILRVHFQEENTTAQNSSYFYSDMMFLVSADGTSLKPLKSKDGYGPDASIKRDNWVDFAVPASDHPDQYTLRLGTSTETQITIPLKKGTNLDQYKPQTAQPNNKIDYAGTHWTLTNVSRQLSYAAKQADQGQVFIVTTYRIDNPGQNTFYPFPSDILRLKSGETQASPFNQGSSFPSNIAAGQSNVTATCAFMMPADSSDFTLTWLPNSLNGTTQAVSTSFHIAHS